MDRNVQTGELSNAKPYIIDGTLIPGLDKRSKRKKWEIQSAPTVIVDGEKMWVMVYLEKKLQILELTSQSVDSPGAEIRGDFQPNARSASPSSAGPSAPTVSPPDSFLDKLITLLNQALDRLQQTGEAAAGAVATSVSKGVVASKRVYYPLDVDKLSAMGSNAIQSVEDDIGAPVLSVAVSPNGEYLAVGTAQIWTARNNTRQEIPGRIVMFQRSDGNLIKVKEFVSHKGDVNSVAFSPTGDRILSGSDDSTLKLWDVTATPDAQNVVHDSLKTFKGHTYAVMSVAFSPKGDRLVSGSLDWSLKLWDINATSVNGDVSDFLVSFESQADITAVAFSPNGDRIVSGSEDGTLKLWNASASLDAKSVVSEPLAKFIGHSDKINSVVFNPKGDRIASGSIDKTIMMWDAKPAKVEVTQPLVSFHEHLNNVNSVAFHPHGDILVSGSEDGRLKLWDALAQPDARGIVSKSLATFEGHRATVWSAIFDPEGKHILSGGMDRTVRQWTLPTLSTPMELPIIPMRGENALGLAQPPLPHNSLRLLENLLVFLTAMKTKIQRPLPPPSGDANEVDVAPSSGFFFFPVMGDLPIELLLVGVVILYGPGLLRIFNQWSRLWRRGPVFSQSSWPEIEPHGLEDWGALSFERQLASPKPSQQLMIVQVNNRTDVEKTIQAHEKMKEEQRKKQALVMVGPEELTAQVGDHLLIDQRQLLDNGGDLSLSSVIQTALMSPSQSLESFKKAFAGGDLEIVLSIRDAHWTVGEAVQWKGRLYNMESIPLKIFLRETLVQWFLDNPSKPQTLDQFFKSLKASALAA
ncbi:MAG: hypothetical protein KCHDKBKB_01273 [Elusimicrobia bacterium]|nr:hypothetical protein [Elusimicrobiota bacterium]